MVKYFVCFIVFIMEHLPFSELGENLCCELIGPCSVVSFLAGSIYPILDDRVRVKLGMTMINQYQAKYVKFTMDLMKLAQICECFLKIVYLLMFLELSENNN